MKIKNRFIVGITMTMCLLMATIHCDTPRAYAAGGSSENGTTTGIKYYKWHRAESTDDLKRYIDDNGNITDYTGKWVPIVLVANYWDNQKYYVNRQSELKSYYKNDKVPYMKAVDNTTSTGAYLKNAIDENKSTFITKGDMGAMHMYYHGNQTSNRNGGASITADAWSLTSSDVTDYSSENPKEVWGIQNHQECLTFDMDNVEKWSDAKAIPISKCPRGDYTGHEFQQAWTFYQYTSERQFLLANPFAWPLCDDLTSSYWKPAAHALILGCDGDKYRDVLTGFPEWSARATVYSNTEATRTYSGDKLRSNIVSAYDNYFMGKSYRMGFTVYIGEEISGTAEITDTTISNGSTMQLNYGNIISNGHAIYVKKGGTLIIPEDSVIYLDGTIYIEGGTVIVGKNACISSLGSTIPRTGRQDDGIFDYFGRIECYDSGLLLLQEGSKVFLNHGLSLDNAVCVNNGNLVLNQMLTMNDAQLQIGSSGHLGVGFMYGINPEFFVLETKYPSQNLRDLGVSGNHYNPSIAAMSFNNSKILVDSSDISSKIEMSTMTYDFLNGASSSNLKNFESSCVEFYGSFGETTEKDGFSFVSAKTVNEYNSAFKMDCGIRLDYNDANSYTYVAINPNTYYEEYMVMK